MFLPINHRIIGEEYRDKPFTGKNICEDRGINIIYNSRKHRFSSSELRQRNLSIRIEKREILMTKVFTDVQVFMNAAVQTTTEDNQDQAFVVSPSNQRRI